MNQRPITQTRMSTRSPDDGPEGWLPKGLRVSGKHHLIATLRDWLTESRAPTIGDTSSFHGRFWISADISGYRVKLAADTTREAVQTVVDQATADPEPPWHVVANQLGRINKVVVG
jgi:hypothetical protein